ncbi:MAG: glycosyltransferase [Gemmatimonadota bacterium]|nr:glycosyltransferase [Gemmatimonadota bacterium]
MPKVSVVTTVYNGMAYFDRAIPGILAQRFTDFEFIIVDDGSQDDTVERLREVASRDSRIRIFTPGRLGFAAAVNYGIQQATGEYIARQDFDDTSYADRLQLQSQYLDAHPGVGVVGSYYVLVDDNRGERYVRMPPTDHAGIISAMARYIPFAHTMVMFRRQAWAQAGGYPEVPNLVDLRFWLELGKLGWRFANLPEVLGEHYVHASSFFHQSFRYVERQRDLAHVQARVVRELRLPGWMYVYSLGRHVYAYLPVGLKRALRRRIGGLKERDV